MYNIKNTFVIILILSTVFLSCSENATYKSSNKSDYEHMVLSTLYSQISAENKALQYQAFNISRYRVDEYINNNDLSGNEAIVIDVDETILETSIYQVKMILNNMKFSTGWEDYINSATCKPINGALDFLNYVDSLGIKIFYISNRNHNQMDALIQNLNKYYFPQVEENNIYLKKNSSNKEERRKIVSAQYNIILYLGDSLEDFSNIFSTNTNEERIKKVRDNSALFGNTFIIFPNSSYGTWESIIYSHNWDRSSEEMESLRNSTLQKLLEHRN